MLHNGIVLGVCSDSLRKKLIAQGSTLTLEAAVRTCCSEELATSAVRAMPSVPTESIAAVTKQRFK